MSNPSAARLFGTALVVVAMFAVFAATAVAGQLAQGSETIDPSAAGVHAVVVDSPVITDIHPAFAAKNHPTLTLTVRGSGFVAPTFGTPPSPGTVVRLPTGLMPTPAEVLPTTFISSTELQVLLPGADTTLTRGDLAKLTVLSQFSESGITEYLNETMGIFCSYADVPCPGNSGTVTDATGVSGWRYLETMYRLGWSGNCSLSDGLTRIFCTNASANVLGSPGRFDVTALNLLGTSPEFTNDASSPVEFVVQEATVEVPALSRTGLLGLAVLLGAAGAIALRVAWHRS